MEFSKREPSRWIFSRELRDSTQTEGSETDERMRPYIVTPLGTRLKRIFFCGTITTSSIEENSSRLVIADPVGSFYVSASSAGFNEPVRDEMSKFNTGDRIAVMGKVSIFKAETGNFLFTINPERIWSADDALRNFWNARTLIIARRRVLAIKEAQKLEKPSEMMLIRLGYSPEEAHFALLAVNRYKDYDYSRFIESATTSVRKDQSDEINRAKKSILEIIDRHSDDQKGVSYETILGDAAAEGIDKKIIDDSLNALGNDGEVYEVSLKRFKRVS
ncbi:MAG: hypothetical protein M1454_05295 [Candidatus Thermoplasmatota archaeon]|nr:hypothetical protein [Candidatus Thermoplasmatota archaeon]MCL5731242.1 hypothetical protein [Candidatus Thermoplasmatota archaeon]